jgi:hypothetical protein
MRKLLLVEWADAHDGTETWTAIEDLADDGEVIITSIGIQLDEEHGGKKGHIALAQSIDEDHVDNVLYVPLGMVRKITALQFDGIVP